MAIVAGGPLSLKELKYFDLFFCHNLSLFSAAFERKSVI